MAQHMVELLLERFVTKLRM